MGNVYRSDPRSPFLVPVVRALLLALLGSSAGAAREKPPFPEHAAQQVEALAAPEALTFAPDGTLLVCETGADRVARLGPSGELLARFGAGWLRMPAGIAAFPDGRALVSDTGAHRLVLFSKDGEVQGALGGPGAAPGRFHRPLGLALDSERGRIAVCDAGNRRVQVLDLEGRPLFVIGGDGADAPVRFVEPVACAFADDGTLVVVDRGGHAVHVFDGRGSPLRRWGDFGAYPGLLAAPTGVAFAGGRVFVSERENHRVQVFDVAGNRLGGFGVHALRPGEGAGKLHYPTGLAVRADGTRLALTEPLDDRVQVFSSTAAGPADDLPPMPGAPQPAAHYGPGVAAGGALLVIAEPETRSVLVFDDTGPEPRLVARVGRAGSQPGQFLVPLGLHLDEARGRLVVTDPALRRVSVFQLRGHPQPAVRFDPLYWTFVKSVDLGRLHELQGAELGVEAPPEPGAVTANAAGELFVADTRNDCVWVLSPALLPVRRIGGRGDGPGQLRGPAGLALAPDGQRLYVTESIGARVQVFGPAGEPLGLLAPGDGVAALARPHGVAVDGEGRVFLTDAGTHRVLSFSAEGELVAAVGGRGLAGGRFAEPRGVALDGLGRVVVIDHANHRGQRLDGELGFLGAFGSRLYVRAAARRPAAEEVGR